MIKKFFKWLNQKGQSMVLYALLTPLMFLAGAAATDLGWYYLNCSRLQDAADAAVIAGAKEFKLDNYKSPVLVYNSEIPSTEFENSGVDAEVIEQINNSKIKADEKARKFLKVNSNATESQEPALYRDDDNNFYYVVKLKENNVKHLFDIMNVAGELQIEAVAAAKLAYQTPSPTVETEDKETFEELAAINVINGNWELESARSRGKWVMPTTNTDNFFVNLAITSSYSSSKTWINFNTPANMYVDGTSYRYAILDVVPSNGQKKTTLKIDENYRPDSINLGFRQDIIRVAPGALEVRNGKVVKVGTVTDIQFEEDWDIRFDEPYNRKTEVRYINKNNKGSSSYWYPSFDLRIHNVFNFNYAYEIRADKVAKDKSNPYDILWTRIESEAFLPLKMLGVTDKDNHVQYKSVRQIVLNINVDNTIKENGKLKYRPIIMFYDGPERFDNNSTVRASKPIILNLNANFNGILYAPTSPVIFNGNGYKFNGFIVAKKYMKLKKGTNAVHYNDKIFVDENGEVLAEDIIRSSYGKYERFGIKSFSNYNYDLEDNSQDNLFTS